MPELSVIICSHNPRPDYLRRTLEGLRAQTLPLDRWELLLVDNASTTSIADTFDLSWHPLGRHIHETELGLAPARRRGMREAAADVFVCVDDDNVLASNYLSQAGEIGRNWPSLGVWGGGKIIGEFEVPPPRHLQKYLFCLALRDTDAAHWTNIYPCVQATPWGAGMCVRRSVAAAYEKDCAQSDIQVTGRRGGSLMSCEDVEISIVACNTGLGMGIFPDLKLLHLIPKERLVDDYILKVYRGTALSTCLLNYKWQGIQPKTPLSIRGALAFLKHIAMFQGFDRRMYLAALGGTVEAARMIGQTGTVPPSRRAERQSAFLGRTARST